MAKGTKKASEPVLNYEANAARSEHVGSVFTEDWAAR